MAITQRGSAVTLDISNATGTQAFSAKPTGTVATDVLVAVWGRNNAQSGSPTVTAPSGWTQIGTTLRTASGTNSATLQVYWALGNVASLSFTMNAASGTNDTGADLMSFTGVDNTTPIDVSGTASGNTGSATIAANAISIVTANAWEMIGVVDWNAGGTYSATGYTANVNAAAHCQVGLLVNSTGKAVGSTGTATVTDTSGATSQILTVLPFALRPASSGGTTYNETGSGGIYANGSAVVVATYSVALTPAGLWASGTAKVVASYSVALTSAGLWANGSAPFVYNLTSSGGLWASGSAPTTASYSNALTSAGVYGNGSAPTTASYSNALTSAGIYASGSAPTTASYSVVLTPAGLWANGSAPTTASYSVVLTPAGVFVSGTASSGANTYNQTGSGGVWSNGSAPTTATYTNALTSAGLYLGGTAPLTAAYTNGLIPAGVSGNGTAPLTAAYSLALTPAGFWANGSAPAVLVVVAAAASVTGGFDGDLFDAILFDGSAALVPGKTVFGRAAWLGVDAGFAVVRPLGAKTAKAKASHADPDSSTATPY